MAKYMILWGHSGERGKHWVTAREASRYAAEQYGTVEAKSSEDAIEIVRSETESQGGKIVDWYVEGRFIHIV